MATSVSLSVPLTVLERFHCVIWRHGGARSSFRFTFVPRISDPLDFLLADFVFLLLFFSDKNKKKCFGERIRAN